MIPLRDTVPSFRFPIVTVSLIGVNVLVFLMEINMSALALEHFFQTWGIIPLRFTHARLQSGGNYFTLLSSMFLHGGWMHIIGNMWSLWIFGDNVEDRMGRGGFLLFYLLSGLTAGAVHVVTNAASTVPTVGASGAIAGVMGAYLLLFPHASVVTLVPVVFSCMWSKYQRYFSLASGFSCSSSVVHCRWRRLAPRPEAWPGGPTSAGLWWGFCGPCRCAGGPPSPGADGDMTMMTGRGMGPLIASGTAEE